jgi:hypothetical protein
MVSDRVINIVIIIKREAFHFKNINLGVTIINNKFYIEKIKI